MNLDDRGPLCTCGHGKYDHWEPTGADIAEGRPGWHCLLVSCPCEDFQAADSDTTPREGE